MVVAVNGYNESRDVVQAFVERASLTYPILLQGRDVAKGSFAVAGYPTSFWIDRQGRVADHHTGFSKEEAPELEQRLKELL